MVNSVPARALGAPHERERVFIVAHAQGEPEREQADQTDTKPIGRLSWMEPSGIPEHLRAPAAHVAHASGQQMGPARQPRVDRSLEKEWPDPNAEGIRRGQGRTRRPPDSFARIRDEARRNAADPYGARLAFREGIPRDAWEKLTPAEREAFGNERQSIWPDESPISRVDDVTSKRLDKGGIESPNALRVLPHDASPPTRGYFSERSAGPVPALPEDGLSPGIMPNTFNSAETARRSEPKENQDRESVCACAGVATSIWPDIPALLDGEDRCQDWMDRVKETGNTIVRLIPQLIGEAILAARRENRGKPVNPKLTPKAPLEYSGVQA